MWISNSNKKNKSNNFLKISVMNTVKNVDIVINNFNRLYTKIILMETLFLSTCVKKNYLNF